jgi:hypothetical protein
MPRRVHLPSHLAGSPFIITQARISKVGYGRTRSADLAAPFHGVRVPSDREEPETTEERVIRLAQDYSPRLKPGQVFCELTALALFGVPVPGSRRNEHNVHIGAIQSAHPPRARGTIPHYAMISATYQVRGLPVCNPIEAWMQCAGSVSVDELVMLGDSLVRRKNPLTTIARLRDAVESARGRPGAADLRAALALVRARTDSPRETVTRLLIIRSGLPEPIVNLAIVSKAGKFLGFGDLVYEKWRVIIEYDGDHHFGLDAQRVKDLDRVARFVGDDWRVVQVHREHLAGDPTEILERIRDALIAGGWRP